MLKLAHITFTTLSRLVVIVLASLNLAGGAHATTTRVDDNGTVVGQGVLPMRWKQLVPGKGADHSVEGSVRVAVQLNVANWINQPVRLYMALASAAGEPIYVSWRTQGKLLPGSIRSGSRALIFNGVVTSASLQESIELTIKTDGRALVAPQDLQFYFEIDTP